MILQYKNCPDWFNLNNYESCKQFSRRAWINALIPRISMYEIAVCGQGNIYREEEKDDYLETIKTFASYELIQSCIEEAKTDYGMYSRPTSSITDIVIDDYLTIHDHIRKHYPELPKKIEKFIQQVKKLEKKYQDSIDWRELFSPDLSNETEGGTSIELNSRLSTYLHIDLNATNETLLADFQDWLTKKREELKKQKIDDSRDRKRVSDNELQKYANYQILAYLDLFLWGEITGRPITKYNLGCILFPDAYDANPAERIRTVVEPKIMKILKLGVSILE